MNANILLIEDNVKTARLLAMDLMDAGYQVKVAHDGLLGLALAHQSHPDLILLDWKLPGLSGLELCRGLRRLGHTMPILFLTAMAEADQRTMGLAAGASDYIIKPFDSEALLTILGNYLQTIDLAPTHSGWLAV
ncbi:MAG: response regulator [Cyanobacteria bacterium P01_H01_bin.119]